jgi:hypothetical protein
LGSKKASFVVIFLIAEYLLKNLAFIKCMMTMSTRLKKLVLISAMTAILLSLTFANLKIAFSDGDGGKIDLFTQKEPYSGKGPDMPSDAFGLEEVVILYALATYNEVPLQNLLVAFNVETPINTSFSLSSRTNSNGIATVNFTVPQKCVNPSEAFGEWFALANVLIDGTVFQDTLIFKVDWIVKLVSVRTIDENLTYRSSFGIGGDVGLEITLKNIAMGMKNATIAIVIQDELGVPVNFSMIRNFEVHPNEKFIFVYCKLYLPKWSHVGMATALVSALTASVSENEVPYCPSISTDFSIMPYEPLTIAFHDAAVVDAVPSATLVDLGQNLSIGVVVRNEGTEVESFNVSTYLGSVLIGTLEVAALTPYSKTSLKFNLNTSLIGAGNYTVIVSIPQMLNEADLTDNFLTDGVVEIKLKLPVAVHDIAIVDIKISNSSLYIGDLLHINVSVVNKGTENETFNVGTYYDSSLIKTLQVDALSPKTQATLIFVWNTSSVRESFYQVSASAFLLGDIDTSDNTYVDGVVQVKAKPPPPIKQYYLTLRTDPPGVATILGEGWYDESSNVTINVPEVSNYIFDHWKLDNVDVGSVNPYTVAMDKNHTLKAVFSQAPSAWFVPGWFYWLLLILLILIITLLIAWFYCRKRRKEAEEAFYTGWTAWYYCYDLRSKTKI